MSRAFISFTGASIYANSYFLGAPYKSLEINEHLNRCCQQATHPSSWLRCVNISSECHVGSVAGKPPQCCMTFIYICCQRITFLSYERLPGTACSNVSTHWIIIRTLGRSLKGTVCDLSINKEVAPRCQT